ncbi:MAG: hypothetical protein GC164_02085 [Phycisphaera sp.]|nr:hypothetical protein [Phycisphaera sp.]
MRPIKIKPQSLLWIAWCGVVVLHSLSALAGSDDRDSAKSLAAQFISAGDADARKAVFDQIISSNDQPTLRAVGRDIEGKLTKLEKVYSDMLGPRVHDAYLKRLGTLTDEQVRLVVATRRLWKSYLLNGGDIKTFREDYFKPIWEMRDVLLPKIEEIEDTRLQSLRSGLMEFGQYQTECYTALAINADPTVGRQSPTGIAYPPLDQPPTFVDRLHHLERTLVLGYSVAPEGARRVLLLNNEASREIDVQEAEFVMFCNEARMLAGTVAWCADPLGCAVERDHSQDRLDGNASGHMSNLPGKHGFTDRNRRMGAPFFNSEGAGGGRDGRDYANALSYGGGHTGPLYSLKRNCVGVGRRKGVYTSQYRFDKSLVHPCQATSDELWMPPGLDVRDIGSAGMKRVYQAMKAGQFGAAKKALEQADPGDGIDGVFKKFFLSAIDAEVQWTFQSITEIEKTGDLYAAATRLADARNRLGGIEDASDKLGETLTRFKSDENRATISAGEQFYRVINSGRTGDAQLQLLGQYYQRYKETDYGRAIKALIDDKDGKTLWSDFFVAKNPRATGYDYPPKTP